MLINLAVDELKSMENKKKGYFRAVNMIEICLLYSCINLKWFSLKLLHYKHDKWKMK